MPPQDDMVATKAASANTYNVCFILLRFMELEIIAQSEAYGTLVHDAVVKHVGTDRECGAIGERNVVAVKRGSAESVKLFLLLVRMCECGFNNP